MTTTLDRTTQPPGHVRSRSRDALVVLAGMLGGITLGILARVWMRVIATDPEFTLDGTMFIVLGFAIFGLAQSLNALARRRDWRAAAARPMRIVGCIGMLPLFVGAGAIMAPTVIAGGLAMWRSDWRRWVRTVLGLFAMVPVVVVSLQIAGDFGWDIRTVVGIIGMLGVYACIVRATRSTLLRPLRPWGLRRVAMVIGVGVALLVILQVGLRR
jgi:F0F1-type ATP synthase membrane subunit c/vacuolar-type H+-ATPase subunit K